jgi:amino acid transporter
LGTIPMARLSISLVVAVIITFSTYTIWGYTTARDFDDLFEVRHSNDTFNEETRDVVRSGTPSIDWDQLVNTLFYKFDGIYMASVFGGEVLNPARTFPRAIYIALFMAVATYLVPIPASIVADSLSWMDFDRNAYPTMAFLIGGSTLKTFIFIGSLCASIGQFCASIFIKAFMVSGMAANRILPMALARRSERFEAPSNAILITSLLSIGLAGLNFNDLLPLSNAFAAVVQFVIIVAAIRLRMTLPYIPRPTKVPGGVPGLILCSIVPAAVLGYILIDCFLDSLIASVLLAALLVVGIAYGFWAVRWN